MADDTYEAALGRTLWQQQEEQIVHNPYAHEQRKLDCIRRGDTDGLIACQTEKWSGQIGKVGETPLRQAKNIGIIVIVLASRAAIDGGLPSEMAFTLADTCILSIEAMSTPDDVYRATHAYEADFCRRVAALPRNTTANAHVRRAKAFIAASLHEPLTVQDAASAAGVTADHLSELFRLHEGLPLQAYIRREKLRRASHLLRYGTQPVGEIAAVLAFSSQSHFAAAFRREFGMPPQQYRDNFASSRD